MSRGGKRPGAGAPKGNLNALKHGRRSRQFATLGALVAASPAARKLLLRLADRQAIETRKADELASDIIEQVISRGLKRGRDRLLVLPPVVDGPTINKTRKTRPSPISARRGNAQNTPPHNQSPDTKSDGQSENSRANSTIERTRPTNPRALTPKRHRHNMTSQP